jgi:uncharacterized protein YdeI (YjbR/CyaY-like superfamily)
MITIIDDFFSKGCGRCDRFETPECSALVWNVGVKTLRDLCLKAGMEESVKWGHPCYMFAGRNIVLIGALRGDYRLNFFNAALMKDPERVLERQGPNTQHPDSIRFTTNGQAAAMASTITAYLKEAMAYAAEGRLPPKVKQVLELPVELAEALDADVELAEAFHALTPGRQKSYVINLNGAKKPETRIQRIAKFRNHIIAGKGAMEQ